MTAGTKIFLAVFAAFIGVLVLYYGVLMPEVQGPPAVNAATRNTPPSSSEPVNPQPKAPPFIASDPRIMPAVDPAAGFLTSAVQNSGVNPADTTTPAAAAPPDSPATNPAAQVAHEQSPLIANQPVTLGSEPVAAPALAQPTTTEVRSVPVQKPVPQKNPASPQTVEYVVKNGDTMSSIAEVWFGDRNKWSLIARENPLVDPNRLGIGDKLRLPPKDAKLAAVKEQVASDQPMYVVRSGDTLSKIAREYYNDVSKWKAIYDANRSVIGNDPAVLKAGIKLKLPPPGKPASN